MTPARRNQALWIAGVAVVVGFTAGFVYALVRPHPPAPADR